MDTERAADDLEVETRRVVDRLRTLALDALARRADEDADGDRTRADLAHATAQALAAAAAELEGTGRHVVPRLADSTVADQVAVCAADLAAAVRAGGGEAQAAGALAALRRLRGLL
ncbi:hypothetical protein CLV35_0184 [Motilibacter peucedani]|uniref:Uncharacterized protein n=1 Tax=Motilibacter peucedani TaxID=598650 RepID=A0A420XV66_9ACTN|nr:hypothetical protein [Motilibacter peucedani]RKS80718.1 hypothetical protein CLV35_0184 [Motilibacter peucedani]